MRDALIRDPIDTLEHHRTQRARKLLADASRTDDVLYAHLRDICTRWKGGEPIDTARAERAPRRGLIVSLTSAILESWRFGGTSTAPQVA